MVDIYFRISKDTKDRQWAIREKRWLPERTDHPLESEPTSWNLVERKRSQSQYLQRQRTMPNLRLTTRSILSIMIYLWLVLLTYFQVNTLIDM
jgi:hypothetical protein